MKIGGLQKVSLIDYPGVISAVVFSQGCNFKCGYCHNPELVDPERFSPCIDEKKIMEFLATRSEKTLKGSESARRGRNRRTRRRTTGRGH